MANTAARSCRRRLTLRERSRRGLAAAQLLAMPAQVAGCGRQPSAAYFQPHSTGRICLRVSASCYCMRLTRAWKRGSAGRGDLIPADCQAAWVSSMLRRRRPTVMAPDTRLLERVPCRRLRLIAGAVFDQASPGRGRHAAAASGDCAGCGRVEPVDQRLFRRGARMIMGALWLEPIVGVAGFEDAARYTECMEKTGAGALAAEPRRGCKERAGRLIRR